MTHDADFFLGLAEISESVATTALDHLCAKSDRAAIEGFMAAVTKQPELFPDTMMGNKLPLFAAVTKFENGVNIRQSSFDMIALTMRQDKAETPCPSDELAHLARVLDFAATLTLASNPFERLASRMVKFNTDPEPIRLLLSAAEKADRPVDRLTMIATAMVHNNLSAALSVVDGMDDASLLKAMPDLTEKITVHYKAAQSNWVWDLAKADRDSSECTAAKRLFDTLDERTGVYAIAPLRVALMAAFLNTYLGTDEPLGTDDFFHISGMKEPNPVVSESLEDAMDAWKNKEPHQAVNFVRNVVRANLVELLPTFCPQMDPDNTEPFESLPRIAIEGGFLWADGPEGARRLKETLAQLEDLGHNITHFSNGETPLTHLARDRVQRPNRFKTLAVLLDMGHDPSQRGDNNLLAVEQLRDGDEEPWNHVVNAHRARATTRSILNEIHLSP